MPCDDFRHTGYQKFNNDMDILSKLFGSEDRIKILRLFLFSSTETFSFEDVIARTRVETRDAKKEIVLLQNIGLIKKKPFVKDVVKKVRGKELIVKEKGNGFTLDDKFPYLLSLKNLLITVSLHDNNDIIERISKVGRIKALIVAGVFIQDWESRVDMLVVGEGISMARLDSVVKILESEIGKEIRYSAFETPDFEYRLGIYDKLIRDILDFPHTKLIDKLDLDNR